MRNRRDEGSVGSFGFGNDPHSPSRVHRYPSDESMGQERGMYGQSHERPWSPREHGGFSNYAGGGDRDRDRDREMGGMRDRDIREMGGMRERFSERDDRDFGEHGADRDIEGWYGSSGQSSVGMYGHERERGGSYGQERGGVGPYGHGRERGAVGYTQERYPGYGQERSGFIANRMAAQRGEQRDWSPNVERSGGQGYGHEYGGTEQRWGRSTGQSDMGLGERDYERGPHYGKGPKGYKRSDERIREEVCEVISRQGFVDASDVEVIVEAGVVRLVGSVPQRQDKRALEQMTDAVHGVDEVRNELRLKRMESGKGPPSQNGPQAQVSHRNARS